MDIQLSDNRFELNRNNRIIPLILIAIGLIAVVVGFMTDPVRAWSVLLQNDFYFTVMALGGTFFLAIQYVAQAGWAIGIQRIMEAMGGFLKYGMLGMLLIFIFGHHDLYYWTHGEYYDPASAHYDPVLVGKHGFLNIPFYVIRLVLYGLIWIGFTMAIRKNSLLEDINGGLSYYRKNVPLSAVFIVLFAITSSTSAWDFLMSIDARWFSTLFGWYIFAGLFVSALAMMCMMTLYLKGRGYLKHVNENHLHDLGKFMFAFSIFWTYLWFSQFMLIWYANLPEEVVYYQTRWEHFRTLWWLNLLINFLVPFLVLMTRDAKRQRRIMYVAGVIILFGHWLDVFLMVMPGTVGQNWHLGFIEFGTAAGFLGLFLWSTYSELAKGALIPKHHPMTPETLHHHI